MRQKTLLKSMVLLLCALTAGSVSSWAGEELYYTLDGTVTTGGNSNYAQDGGGLTQNGIEWSATANTTINPWRIGGKNLTNVDRDVYSKTAMGDAITKIELEIGGITLSSVNSITLTVASDASFNNVIETKSVATITANTTQTFTPTSAWATGAYYKFTFNVSAGGSNSYIQLKSAKFYHNVSTAPLSSISVDASDAQTTFYQDDEFSSDGIVVTATYEDESTRDVTENATVSTPDMTTTGTKTVTVTFEDKTATYEISVLKAPTAYKYKKVTEQSEIGEGFNYLIVYDTHAYAGVSNNIGQQVEVTVQNNIITNPSSVAIVQLEAAETEGNYYIKDGDNYLKGQSSNNLYTSSLKDDGTEWTITPTAITNFYTSGDSRGLRYNTSSPRFCNYKPGNTAKDVVLYRQIEDATITSAGYATFHSENAVDFSGTGVTVYTATDNGSSVKLTKVTSGKVPASIPVVLYKEGGETVSVPVIEDAAELGSNDLKISTGESPANAYVLAKPEGKEVGFYLWDNSVELNAGKVYLQAASGARQFMPFADATDATAISDTLIEKDTVKDAVVYDLQGRRVAQPAKGLYIVDGRKIIVK